MEAFCKNQTLSPAHPLRSWSSLLASFLLLTKSSLGKEKLQLNHWQKQV